MKLIYGNGEMVISQGERVIGFDIKLKGNYIAESYEIPNFMIMSSNDRIIGVGLGSALGGDPFLKYSGDLKVRTCIIVDNNMNKKIIGQYLEKNSFEEMRSSFNSVSQKFEDLNKGSLVGDSIGNVQEIKTINKNLNTKGDQFRFQGEDYIGDYYIDSDGIAKSGVGSEQKILKIKNKRNSFDRVRQSIITSRARSSEGTY